MKFFKILWAVIQFPVFIIRDLIDAAKEYLRPKCPDCNGTLVFLAFDEDRQITILECLSCGRQIIDGRGL